MSQEPGIESLLRTHPVKLEHPDAVDLRTRIAYDLMGPASAPVALLIPGGAGAVASSALTTVGHELAADHRVLIVETRGAPSVTLEPRGFTTLDLADDVVDLLDHLEIRDAHVVGASLGSMIAQHVAARLGTRCLSAVLALSTAGGDPFFHELMSHLAHVARTDPRESPVATSLWAAGGGQFERWSGLLPERGQDVDPPVLEGLARRYEAAAHHDARERLASITERTLVVAAADDLMLRPALGRELARRIPHASFEVWADATHMCINEIPGRFAARCREFIDGPVAGSAPGSGT